MNEALYKRDWKEAAKEGRDSRWYRQVTNRAEIDVKNGRGRRLMEFLLELAATFWILDCSHRHYYCCVGNQ